MTKTFTMITLAMALAPAACSKSEGTGRVSERSETVLPAATLPKDISVEELASLLKGATPPNIFDANGESTREKYGSIPAAALLESSSGYDLGVLPADRSEKLVFYCSNQRCKAGEGAAKKAASAGFSDIHVLRAGIAGWVEAGKKTTRLN